VRGSGARLFLRRQEKLPCKLVGRHPGIGEWQGCSLAKPTQELDRRLGSVAIERTQVTDAGYTPARSTLVLGI
jgi:hypothetical protein